MTLRMRDAMKKDPQMQYVYDFLLSLAFGLSFVYPHFRHFVAFGGFVTEQDIHTDLSRSLLSASLKRAMLFSECSNMEVLFISSLKAKYIEKVLQ